MSSMPPPAAPIRQPRGPSANGGAFNAAASPVAPASGTASAETHGPPPADSDLRRANTVSTPRHHVSASISSTPAASRAFHGSRLVTAGRYRRGSSGSGLEGDGAGGGQGQGLGQGSGLSRHPSTREVRTEEVLLEGGEEGTIEVGSWGKGLSRQSSLPSRRGFEPAAGVGSPVGRGTIELGSPPRRLAVNTAAPPSMHAPSHSLSSLAVIAGSPNNSIDLSDMAGALGAAVSRTQSLRAQAKHELGTGSLGRSASLRAPGEYLYSHQRTQSAASALSAHSNLSTPRTAVPPTPPPVSSAAAFPPVGMPVSDSNVKRHQSLNQGLGGSRFRDRLERSQAYGDRLPVEANGLRSPENLPPSSPINHSMWSMAQPTDDGWTRSASQQMQEAFEQMQMNRRTPVEDQEQPPPAQMPRDARMGSEEPSWVSRLVGQDRDSPQPPSRIAPGQQWQNEAYLKGPVPHHPAEYGDRPPYMGMPLGYPAGAPILQPPFAPPPHMRTPSPGHPLYQHYQPPFPGPPTFMPPPYPVYGTPGSAGSAPLASQDLNVIQLAKSKGLNPAAFDCRPAAARFFVIKSYTEEDVQKSLKYEIWSSTVLGNKRLDAAFRESSAKMPIYLFFSVNGSRHFCGVAQMLTPVDESQSSTVWAQDKWKGIFKVKWIFVRDVPTAALRHIRLLNTPEQKPITNSRDTQELHYDAGCEVLQIFLDHQALSKTSLLQDFAYYEQLANVRTKSPMPPSGPPMPVYQNTPPPMMNAPPVPPIPSRYR